MARSSAGSCPTAQDKSSPDTSRGSGLGSREALVQLVCAPELEQRALLV